jgi:hypothetical protein
MMHKQQNSNNPKSLTLDCSSDVIMHNNLVAVEKQDLRFFQPEAAMGKVFFITEADDDDEQQKSCFD